MKLFLVFLKPTGTIQVEAANEQQVIEGLIEKGWKGYYSGIALVYPLTPTTIPTRKHYLGLE